MPGHRASPSDADRRVQTPPKPAELPDGCTRRAPSRAARAAPLGFSTSAIPIPRSSQASSRMHVADRPPHVVAPGSRKSSPRPGRISAPSASSDGAPRHRRRPRARVALLVGRLLPALGEHEKLVTHVEKGHAPHAPAQLELEDATVEVEALGELADLQHHVVDSHQPGHRRSIGFVEWRRSSSTAWSGGTASALRSPASPCAWSRARRWRCWAENGAGKTTLLQVWPACCAPHGGRAVVLDAELPASAGSCLAASAISDTNRCSIAS